MNILFNFVKFLRGVSITYEVKNINIIILAVFFVVIGNVDVNSTCKSIVTYNVLITYGEIEYECHGISLTILTFHFTSTGNYIILVLV